MVVSISYKSESGDDYLNQHSVLCSFDEIVKSEKEAFDDEFGYLYVTNITASNKHFDCDKLESLLMVAIEEAENE